MEPFIFGADSGICKERSDGIAIDRRRRNRVTLFRYPAITIKKEHRISFGVP